MTLQIFQTLRDGGRRVVARNGIVLVGAWFFLSLFRDSVMNGLVIHTGSIGRELFQSVPTVSVTFPGPGPVLWLLFGTSIAGTLLLSVVAFITFTGEDRDVIPAAAYSSHVWGAAARLLVVGVIVQVLATIGFAVLVLPGLYVLVTFGLYGPIVARGASITEAFRTGWRITKGTKIRLFILFFILTVINAGVIGASTILGGAAAHLLTAAGIVFALAVLSQAYVQLGGDTG